MKGEGSADTGQKTVQELNCKSKQETWQSVVRVNLALCLNNLIKHLGDLVLLAWVC